MLQHQRSILATLGIDVWVSNADVKTHNYTTTLFRDMAEMDSHTDIALPISTAMALSIPHHEFIPDAIATSKQDLLRADQFKSQLKNEKPIEQNSEKHTQSDPLLKAESQLHPILDVEAFTVQAYALEHAIILIDSTHLTSDQLTLWNNIQAASVGIPYELKWPFPMPQFQDGRGVVVYIQGFIDAIHQGKKLLSLGKLPYTESADVMLLENLQAMLDQPLLKRQLWQMMQN